MAFCTNCGQELAEGAKFCSNCGTSVNESEPRTQRQTVYEGEIHKCPNCGEKLSAFDVQCGSCGCEIRDRTASKSARELFDKLELATDDSQRITIIKSFPIPSNKEDIFEFMSMATANFDLSCYVSHLEEDDLSDAWLAKIEQCYQKAKKLLSSSEFTEIEQQYLQIKNKCIESENRYKTEQRERELDAKREESAQSFRSGRLRIFLMIFAAISAIMIYVAFRTHNVWSGIIAIGMFALSVISLLMGYNVIKEKIINIRIVFVIGALLLTVPYVSLFDFSWRFSDINSNQIKIGISADILVQNDVETIHSILVSKGFTNITLKEEPFKKGYVSGEILDVSIDGNSYFGRNHKFDKDCIVVIRFIGNPAMLSVGFDISELIGVQFSEVVQKLENIGFINIECKEKAWDSAIEPLTVQEITINGDADFVQASQYPQNAIVIITYYASPKLIAIGYESEKLIGEPLEKVKSIFLNLGFADVRCQELEWVATAEPLTVHGISINGETYFARTTQYGQDATIILTHYGSPKQISLDYGVEELIGENADDVKNMFLSLGFVNIQLVEENWSLFHKSKTVKFIEINGTDSFAFADVFLQDAIVKIHYYK